jgi:hypothetical protein
MVADAQATTLVLGETRGSSSSFEVFTLPAAGGQRVLVRHSGTPGAVLGGTSQIPAVGYGTGSGQHPTFVIMRMVGAKFVSDAFSYPTSGNDPFSSQGLQQLVLSGNHLTAVVVESRQSDPDPQYATDASRMLSRTR